LHKCTIREEEATRVEIGTTTTITHSGEGVEACKEEACREEACREEACRDSKTLSSILTSSGAREETRSSLSGRIRTMSLSPPFNLIRDVESAMGQELCRKEELLFLAETATKNKEFVPNAMEEELTIRTGNLVISARKESGTRKKAKETQAAAPVKMDNGEEKVMAVKVTEVKGRVVKALGVKVTEVKVVKALVVKVVKVMEVKVVKASGDKVVKGLEVKVVKGLVVKVMEAKGVKGSETQETTRGMVKANKEVVNIKAGDP